MTEIITIPDNVKALAKAKPVGLNMNLEYWTPEKAGESKDVVVLGFVIRKFPTQHNPDETHDVPCVVLMDGDNKVFENGSAILVKTLRDNCQQGDMVRITFSGTKKNRKGNNCHNWDVKRLESN